MRVERFRASTMREALGSIKTKLGDDAVILHSRETESGIEIIAAVEQSLRDQTAWFEASLETVARAQNVDLNLAAQESRMAQEAGEVELKESDGNGASKISSWEELIQSVERPTRSFELAPETMDEVSRRAIDFSKALRQEIAEIEKQRAFWTKSEKRLEELKKELAVLKQHLLAQELAEVKERAKLLKKERMERRAREARINQDSLLKDLIAQIAKRLDARGLTPAFVNELTTNFREWVKRAHLNLTHQVDVKKLKKGLIIEMKKMIKVQSPGFLDSKERRLLGLVGADVQETADTTLKIALTLQLAHRKKVAMVIVTDSAPKEFQQTALLASIGKVSLSLLTDPSELDETIGQLEGKEIVLVAYAFKHAKKVAGIKQMVQSIPLKEIHLILPANSQLEQMLARVAEYEVAEVDYLIFSKTAEMKKVGFLVELAYQTGKPISYLCRGNTIPDDLESANALKIAHMILKG